jgi:hypothetical protein
MANQVIAADLVIPAGTPQNAPASQVVPNSSGWVSEITLTFPAGPNGLAGWALELAGTVIIPYAGAGWVIANDYTFTWQLNRWCNAGQLVVMGYNTGVYPHTLRAKFTWQPDQPGLTATASLAVNGPATAATTAAVAALTGYEPPDDTTADLAEMSL